MIADVLLTFAMLVWWTVVFWYASRFSWIRVTAHSWNLLLTGMLLACVLTEELVGQRWMGGWAGHETAVNVWFAWGTLLGLERLWFLWATRRSTRTRDRENATT